MSVHPRWSDARPDDAAWRAPAGRTREEGRREQDAAAGSRPARQLALPDGRTAMASVELKQLGRRLYAYLRHQDGGRTVVRYVGQVTATTREENLTAAWSEARRRGLLDDPAAGTR